MLFASLLKISIGQEIPEGYNPQEGEWRKLFLMAQEQAVVGVCFVGIQRLKNLGYSIPNGVYFEWLANAAQIQQRNEQMNQWTKELCETIWKNDIDCCVLKGQSHSRLYGYTDNKDVDNDLSMMRQPGDIDVWMLTGHKDVIRWGQKNGGVWYYDYHHADMLAYHDADVELHYRPTLSRNLWRNARLQRWFRNEGAKLIDKSGEFPVLNEASNLILVLNHNFWHLMYEGVGMRQMMDLYYVLKGSTDCTNVFKSIRYFRLERFAAASMWVLKEVFGLPERKMVCRPNEKYGRFLLQEIMQAGNFGHADERLKKGRYENRIKLMVCWIKHNMRLLQYYPADVLWTPIGVLYISLWRRWHYLIDGLNLEKNEL